MGLFARVTAQGTPEKIGVHRFGSALRQWAACEVTRQQVIDAFTLTGTDITDLDALRATYDALPTNNAANAAAKAAWLYRMEDVFILCESGDYDETKAKSALGF